MYIFITENNYFNITTIYAFYISHHKYHTAIDIRHLIDSNVTQRIHMFSLAPHTRMSYG